MPNQKHPHFEAAQMAAHDLNTMLKGMKDSPMGKFPMSGPSRGTVARQERIANAPPDIQRLVGEGHTLSFVDMLARAARDREAE